MQVTESLKKLSLFTLMLLVAGCGRSPAVPPERGAAAEVGARQQDSSRPSQRPRGVERDAYADVSQAVAALCQAAEEGDSPEIYRAEAWLAMQDATAVPALTQTFQDDNASLPARIAVCRALGRQGPAAKSVLLEGLTNETSLIRLNAVTALGSLRPADSQVIERLLELLEDDDLQMRRAAIQALGRIGPPAKQAAPALQQILNSQASDTLRGEAKRALQRVDPRRGLPGQ